MLLIQSKYKSKFLVGIFYFINILQITEEAIQSGMKLANVAEIEKVFNETFVPASDHDFLSITTEGDCYHDDENELHDSNTGDVNENSVNHREIFFAHRSAVPDPDEVMSTIKFIIPSKFNAKKDRVPKETLLFYRTYLFSSRIIYFPLSSIHRNLHLIMIRMSLMKVYKIPSAYHVK